MNQTLKSSLVLTALWGALFLTAPAAYAAPTPPGSVADGDPCATAADCKTSGATCEGTPTVCTPPVTPKKRNTEACLTDDECDSGFCTDDASRVCEDQVVIGQACSRPEACSSGLCDKGKCVECTASSDCAGMGEACVNNACLVPAGSVKDGDACTKDGDCVSGDCADTDGDGADDKCAPKAAAPTPTPVAPQPVPVPVVKPTSCPPGFVAAEFPPASGIFVCVPMAPLPTAPPVPTPAPAPVPAPVQPAPTSAEVCASFPMSDLTSSDASDQIFGCVAFAAAQVCGSHGAQTWTDCATMAQRVAKGGAPSLQRFYAAGLKLIAEKLWNRSSQWHTAKADVVGMSEAALRSALRSAPEWTDLLRLATGTVTGASRGIGKPPARRTGKPTALDAKAPACTGVSCQPPAPRCPPISHRALDGSGEWGCLQQGTGLWVPPLK